jgi:hypothetical protein
LTVVESPWGRQIAGLPYAPNCDGLVSSTFSRRNKGLVLSRERHINEMLMRGEYGFASSHIGGR